jgi:hypothetical protein
VPRPTARPSDLTKPTMETRFAIDYDWWEQSGKDIHLHIQQLCEEVGAIQVDASERDAEYDWIDPETARVSRVDGVTYRFLAQCSQSPEFITERTTLIEAVFRTLLAAGNRPMTPVEIADRIDRSPETILRTLGGRRVYKGLRPYVKDDDKKS